MGRRKDLEDLFDIAQYRAIHQDVSEKFYIYEQVKQKRLALFVYLLDGKKKFISYPRAILEIHLGRKLKFPDETVDHINSDALDNRIENLQILSLSKNIKKAHSDGIAYRPPKGTRVKFDSSGGNNGMAKISEERVLEYRKKFKSGMTKKQIINETGLSGKTVENFLFGKTFRNVPEICSKET